MSAVLQRQTVASTAAAGPAETLPAWTYNNAEFFALEKEQLFLATWQLVCHETEVPNPGDYATLEIHGERALVMRGEDGQLRAFYNVCRHRAAAVATGDAGHCNGMIRCPYHGWTYALDGRLKAVPGEASFPGLDKAQFGLRPLELESFLGFVFVRFRQGGAGVAERFAPYAEELAFYRLPDMVEFDEIWVGDTGVDWKNVVDNYLEGYHVPVGHPGLYRLYGNSYEVEVKPGYVSRAMAQIRDKLSSNWSERHYQKLLPNLDYLPAERQRAWTYYTLLPNLSFEIYPDRMDFFQVLPTAPGKSRIRARSYRLPNPDRQLRAAQFLNRRINIQVYKEDADLIRSVQGGLGSESYIAGVLSEKEICVRQFHDMIRDAIPVAHLPTAPAPGTTAAVNASLSRG
jgi:phenylpropionate dioxygenase-like ring-hydroxylating dioxygenase large terminal subunit